MKSSLILKINLWIIITVTLCVIVLGLFEFVQVKNRIENDLDATLAEVGRRLGSSLAMPVWNIDHEVVEAILTTEMLNRNVLAIMVSDDLSSPHLYAKSRNEEWAVTDIVAVEVSASTRMLAVPLLLNERRVGAVTVHVTDQFLFEQLVEAVTRVVIRMGMLLVMVVVVLFIVVNRIVSRPLQNLSTVCEKVAYGDYRLELDTSRRDEIGSLARSFAYMREAVKEKIDNLNEQIEVRTQSEADLQSLRSYLGNIIDSMPSILVGVDKKCSVTQWNLEAEKVTAIPKIKAMGKSLVQVLPCMAASIETIKTSIGECRAKKESRVSLDIEGVSQFVDITIYPLFKDGAEGAVIRLDDVTERARMEEVMVQTEKMMTVGGLAAGMAHEINNPLAGIMQSVQVIQNRFSRDLAKNQEIAAHCGVALESIHLYLQQRGIFKMLSAIIEAGHRAACIVDNMLSFSRKSSSRYIPCDLKQLLDKTVELAANDYDLKKKYDFRRIEIVREYAADVDNVPCDPNTIQQVFLNILKNGAQAMVSGGKGGDGTLPVPRSSRITLRIYNDQEYVRVEIIDNGVGMDAATQKRIFEPFFTTKDIGEGTGLGLSVSYFIIKESHNGTIEVASQPGMGTTFTLSLPRGTIVS